MGEFFRGWPRKIGVITLLMALVAMGGWVRSLRICDDIYFCREQIGFSSKSGSFFVAKHSDDEPHIGNVSSSWQFPIWQTFPTFSDEIELNEHHEIKWRLQSLGFGIGEIVANHANGYRICLWHVPYWSIVAPLTLVSVYLLLSKPRKSSQIKIPGPIPSERT